MKEKKQKLKQADDEEELMYVGNHKAKFPDDDSGEFDWLAGTKKPVDDN